MGPGQGGSRLEMGLGGRKYLGRTLGPGQGGSQDYFAKKKEVPIRSENSIIFDSNFFVLIRVDKQLVFDNIYVVIIIIKLFLR